MAPPSWALLSADVVYVTQYSRVLRESQQREICILGERVKRKRERELLILLVCVASLTYIIRHSLSLHLVLSPYHGKRALGKPTVTDYMFYRFLSLQSISTSARIW